MIQVYTGNGKGKTTAALGLALRARGHGLKVIIIQFMKGSREYGEVKAAERFGIELHQFGLESFVKKGDPSAEDLRLAREGFEFAKKTLAEGDFDIVILDEINVAADYGLIETGEVLTLVEKAPPEIELILTGRYAAPEIIDAADLVTEMKEVKHPYSKGIPARMGIDF